MKGKKWDVYVYGDVNIDLVVPGSFQSAKARAGG